MRKSFSYAHSKMDWIISEHVHSQRDRQILRRRFLDGITQDAVANEQQMSKRQIQYIERSFLQMVVTLYQDKLI